MIELLKRLDLDAPGLRSELADSEHSVKWMPNARGLLEPHTVLTPDGPIFRAHLDVFAAKFAMALYREHLGAPIPMTGATYTTVFLNSGLSRGQHEAIVSILPMFNNLKQGSFTSAGQFDYRFNSDDRSIVAALARFHGNLSILAFATSKPELYGPSLTDLPWMVTTRPGELLPKLEGLA